MSKTFRPLLYAAPLAFVAAFGIAAQVPDAGRGQVQDDKTLLATGQEPGWISLFDGKSLDGWKVNDFSNGSHWEVVDGAMCGSGTASMIATERGDFKDYRLRAEVKINDKGNSGMYFRASAVPGFTDGYECQINASHSDPIRTGSIYTWVHLFDAVNAPDEWFTLEVEVKDVDYRGAIATSILVKADDKVLFQFLDHTREHDGGHVAFQQHDPGSKICIRKVEIMPLSDGTAGK